MNSLAEVNNGIARERCAAYKTRKLVSTASFELGIDSDQSSAPTNERHHDG